ncbi:MAG: ABC transporter permease [Candidatus Solibacter usitatus]|nr:ABC transporter permease [Candidatus Solibacter usitatus]
MNWKAFLAMLSRDAHVARRNFVPMVMQTMLQPMLFTFVFGRVLVSGGMMTQSYQDLLIPGVMAITMLMTGVMGVAMPLIAEFQFSREIEDRLLAPMAIEWLAVEKILGGMIQALAAGAVVAPAAWLVLGRGTAVSFSNVAQFACIAILVAMMSSAGGLLLGCSVGQTQIGLLFSMVLAPMIMFGCAYYPWSALAAFPVVQKLVLINPLVYASEGLRGTMTPHVPHMDLALVIGVLAVMNIALIALGLNRFVKKAVG